MISIGEINPTLTVFTFADQTKEFITQCVIMTDLSL